MTVRPLSRLVLGLAGLALACSAGPAGETGSTTDTAEGDSSPAAEIGDRVITVAELDDWIKEDLFERSSGNGDPLKLYELRKNALDQMLGEALVEREAETQGLTPDALVQQETAKRMAVTDEQVRAFYEQNKARLGDTTFEEIRPQIERHLQSQAGPQAAREYLASLRDASDVVVHLEAPRSEVEAVGPARGPEDAPVTIVEFSDYQCPYCKRAEPTVRRVLERYPEQVRFVYRHYPLDRIHPLARPAAEAAACAEAQGRFWDYHEKLFAPDANLETESLNAYAKEIGLDMDRFTRCVEERETRSQVESDVAAGQAAGVGGTPAFFVNGILMSGARPFEDFVGLIEQEIANERS